MAAVLVAVNVRQRWSHENSVLEQSLSYESSESSVLCVLDAYPRGLAVARATAPP